MDIFCNNAQQSLNEIHESPVFFPAALIKVLDWMMTQPVHF